MKIAPNEWPTAISRGEEMLSITPPPVPLPPRHRRPAWAEGEVTGPLKITVDTNTLPVERVRQAAGGLAVDIVATSVTAREVEGTTLEPELSAIGVALENWVMGESRLGAALLGNAAGAELFEKTLVAISNGSFPKPHDRSNLTDRQRRQLRDAMIFCAHVRERRDIFVTDDVTAFGDEGSTQRRRVVALAMTRIMTLAEFERFCAKEPRQ